MTADLTTRLTEAERGSNRSPTDVCVCGDYRRDHADNGPCKLNWAGHLGAPACLEFRLEPAHDQ